MAPSRPRWAPPASIGSARCISTTSRRSKRRSQAPRDGRPGRTAGFSRRMTRASRCSCSPTGTSDPAYDGSTPREPIHVSKQDGLCPGPRRHNRSTWNRVTLLLEAGGFEAMTLDLSGAGVHATAPASLDRVPFDPVAFATEPSPSAGVTQDQRTQAVVALVKEAASRGRVVLVGHSAGGMTISAVAEQVPTLLHAVVYLAGFMVPTGMTLLEMLRHETLSSALAPRLF